VATVKTKGKNDSFPAQNLARYPIAQEAQEPAAYVEIRSKERNSVTFKALRDFEDGRHYLFLAKQPEQEPSNGDKARCRAYIETLLKAASLCGKNGHKGDAETLHEIAEFFEVDPFAQQPAQAAVLRFPNIETIITKLHLLGWRPVGDAQWENIRKWWEDFCEEHGANAAPDSGEG
jgi:hypothetical protein